MAITEAKIGVLLPVELRQEVSFYLVNAQDIHGEPHALVFVHGLNNGGEAVTVKVAHWKPSQQCWRGNPPVPATAVIQATGNELRLMRLVIPAEFSDPPTTTEWFVMER